jgi:SEFIR domain-containing protein
MTSAPPKVFISYSHDTVEHQERVLGLADRLRADGIDAEIDQYNASPPEGWPLWCERQIEAADFVLMVCTETYHRRVKGDEERGKGLGVVWEAGIMRQILYDAGAVGDKFVPVLFSDGSPEQIPRPIRGSSWHVVDREDGYEDLYRRLTGQPRMLRPALGTIRPMPTRSRQWSEGTMAAASSPLNLRAAQKPVEGRGCMEPVSAIVGALSAGAAALTSGALSEAGKDAYKRLRDAILRVVSTADLEKLEQKPNSESRKGSLAEELAEAGKAEDAELVELAQHMITALKETSAVDATGVSLEEVDAINIRLQRIVASGSGVLIKKAKASGDIEISDVSAGVPPPGKSDRR